MTQSQRGQPQDVPQQGREKGYEASDVPARGVVYTGLGLFAFLAFTGALVALTFKVLRDVEHRPATSALENEALVPPPPRLETAEGQDRATIEAAARAHLAGYAWVDRAEMRVRIPIEKAMQLIARQGWPAQEGGAQP